MEIYGMDQNSRTTLDCGDFPSVRRPRGRLKGPVSQRFFE
jgi:hypothetical protein